MPDSLLASSFGVQANGQDMAGPLTDAIHAALAQRSAKLVLPSGLIRCSRGLRFPVPECQLSIEGLGQRITYLSFDNPADDGLAFDCTQGNRLTNWLEVANLALLGAGRGSGTALSIDWGADGINSANSNNVCTQCRIRNLEITNWTHGVYLRNAWNSSISSVFGNGGNLGGKFIRLDGCVGMKLMDLDMSFWGYGVYFGQRSPGYACQGIEMLGVVGEAVPYILSCDPAPLEAPQVFEGLGATGFNFDNGNIPLPNPAFDASIALHNLVGFALRGTQILQSGGLCQIYLNNCISGVVEGCDFTRQDPTHPLSYSVILDGTTRYTTLGPNCRFGRAQAAFLGAQISDCRIAGNLPHRTAYVQASPATSAQRGNVVES